VFKNYLNIYSNFSLVLIDAIAININYYYRIITKFFLKFFWKNNFICFIWHFRNFAQAFSRKIYQLNVSISIANFLFFNRLTVSRHLVNTRVAWPVLRETRHFSSLITRIRLIQKDIRYIIRNIRLNGYSKHLIGSSSLFFPLESWKRKGFLWGAYEVSEISKKIDHSFLVLT